MSFSLVRLILVGILVGSLLAALPAANGNKVRYDNCRIFREQIENDLQLNALRATDGDLRFWKEPILGGTVDVLVQPDQLEQFQQLTHSF